MTWATALPSNSAISGWASSGGDEAAPRLLVILRRADQEVVARAGDAVEVVEQRQIGGSPGADGHALTLGDADFAARVLAHGSEQFVLAASEVEHDGVAELHLIARSANRDP